MAVSAMGEMRSDDGGEDEKGIIDIIHSIILFSGTTRCLLSSSFRTSPLGQLAAAAGSCRMAGL
jgi:hypothetical protein